jgi:hypothetical protein
MESNVLAAGSPVYVTCHSPYWGIRGIVLAVDIIALADTQECMYFYLVALHDGQLKEPLWLVHDDVAEMEGENVSQWRPSRKALSRLEMEALEIVANVFKREQGRSQESLLVTQEEL